jgi:hypothetical protein
MKKEVDFKRWEDSDRIKTSSHLYLRKKGR